MKKILSMLLLCTTVVLASCKKDDPVIIPGSVTFSKTTLPLVEGAKETLTATVTPENATDKSLTWSSSDAAVAAVSATGEVTAVKEGLATITATSVADKTKTATCTVTVTKPVIPVGSITLSKTTLTLLENAKESLTATVAPENATDKSLTWSSSDAAVVAVSATGEVTAVKKGTATITATSVADKTKTATCTVIVAAPAAIGNYYYSDNTYSSVYDNTKTCIGIVYWVDRNNATKGQIVSLDATNLKWSTETVVTGATSEEDGASNTAKVLALGSYTDAKYPAFAWCKSKNTATAVKGVNWYLPASLELGTLRSKRSILNEALRIIGATELSTSFYWSSREYNATHGLIVNVSVVGSAYNVKSDNMQVRAVSAF